ncbi:MAG: hypothetical protein KDI71_10240, partial [Xanthomonadales bacterium]|nr:hypothetical protein [Xanthomonadales bacterium]
MTLLELPPRQRNILLTGECPNFVFTASRENLRDNDIVVVNRAANKDGPVRIVLSKRRLNYHLGKCRAFVFDGRYLASGVEHRLVPALGIECTSEASRSLHPGRARCFSNPVIPPFLTA